MSTLDDATRTQIANIERRTGQSMDELVAMVTASGLQKHGEIVAWLKTEHGFGHGDANLVSLTWKRGPLTDGDPDDAADAIYAGPKAALRPFHDRVIAVVRGFGDGVELAPKQAYVSLRRKKQFGTVGPASGGRLEVGLNLKGEPPGVDWRPRPACARTGSASRRRTTSTMRSAAGCGRPTTGREALGFSAGR